MLPLYSLQTASTLWFVLTITLQSRYYYPWCIDDKTETWESWIHSQLIFNGHRPPISYQSDLSDCEEIIRSLISFSASVSGDSSKCLTIRTLMKVASDELSYALAKYNGNLRISHCRGLGVSRTSQKDEGNHKHIPVPRIPAVQWRSVTPNSWATRSPKAITGAAIVCVCSDFFPTQKSRCKVTCIKCT